MLLQRLLAYLSLAVLSGCSVQQDDSPVVLVAAISSGPGAAVLTFRQDKSCEWLAGMASNPRKGTYQIRDSLIAIEGVSLGGVLKSKRFLITNKNPNNRDLQGLILLQIDEQQNVVDKQLVF